MAFCYSIPMPLLNLGCGKRFHPDWVNVDLRFVKKTQLLGLAELRQYKELAGMRLLAPGNRLSITPVDPGEWKFITTKLLK